MVSNFDFENDRTRYVRGLNYTEKSAFTDGTRFQLERVKFIAVSVKVERLPVSNGDSNVVHGLGIDRIDLQNKLSFIPVHEKW